jgi:hypothetical protein
VIELDQELVTSLECPSCHSVEQVLRPMSEITFEAGHCPTCGILRDAQFTHVITGEENFLHRTLSSIGVPALHILRAQNGLEYRFYELTGDLPEALHFRHFERSETEPLRIGERIRLKGEVQIVETSPARPIRGRIRITDEPEKKPVSVKLAAGNIRLKEHTKDVVKAKKVSEPASRRIRYSGAARSPRVKSRAGSDVVKICKL